TGRSPGRRGGGGLVGGDPHRPCALRVQSAVVAAPAGAVRDRAVDHRRARPRRPRRSRSRNGPAAALVPPVYLADPAVRLRGVRAKISRHEGDAAVCRRVPPGAQSRKPRDVDRGAERTDHAARDGGDAMARKPGEGSMSDTAEILEQAARWREAGSGVALATVVTTWGSSPRPVGAKLAVNDTGAMVGSVSGGCVEGAVVEEALEAIRDGKPRLLDFGVTNDQAWEVGLACGGKIQIFVERVE